MRRYAKGFVSRGHVNKILPSLSDLDRPSRFQSWAHDWTRRLPHDGLHTPRHGVDPGYHAGSTDAPAARYDEARDELVIKGPTAAILWRHG